MALFDAVREGAKGVFYIVVRGSGRLQCVVRGNEMVSDAVESGSGGSSMLKCRVIDAAVRGSSQDSNYVV